jgi:DnaJ-class molecular chaperone
VLGLKRDCTERDIKKAFRKASLKWHPDKNKSPEAKLRFEEINAANNVLGDPDKRQSYDVHGHDGPPKRANSVFDMFGGGGGRTKNGIRKGQDFSMAMPVTLDELYNGAAKSVSIKRKVLCTKCRGTGAKGGATKKCSSCRGKGVVTKLQQLGPGFNVQMQQTCDKCGGKGKTAKHKCPHCSGERLVMETKVLEADIERGMPDGHKIVFERASEQSPDTTPGDVILKLETAKHARFERRGDDLHYVMRISLRDALLGFSKKIKHLDGRRVVVNRKGKITPHDHVEVIEQEGMPVHEYPSQKGKLFVKMLVSFPATFTAAEKKQLEQLLPVED